DVNGGNYSVQPSKISFRGWQYIRCSGAVKMGSGEYPPEYGLDLFVIKVNGRFEKISIVKSRNNCNYSRYYPTNRLKYNNDIENFLFSLQFADLKEADVKSGIAKRDGITGDWQGISMSVGITPLISFTADGNFTDKGALKILCHSYVECVNPANDPGSGTYEVKNYSIIFNYTDGRKIKLAFLGDGYDKNNLSPATLTLSFY